MEVTDLAHFLSYALDICLHDWASASVPLVSTQTGTVMALVAMVPTPRRLCSQWKRAPPSWAPPSWELGPPSVCREVQCHILCPHCACGQGCSPISQRMTLRLLSDLRVPGPDHKASVPSLWQRLPVRCLPWPLQQPLLPERRRTAVLPRREGAVVMIQSFGFGAPSAQ